MSWRDMFRRYGSPSKECEERLYIYLSHPDALTQEKVVYYDKRAAEYIQCAQTLIDNLTEYRQALADRYNKLATAAYRYELKVERQPPSSYTKVKYFVTLDKVYDDGTRITEIIERYEGKQRREALARFEELKKQRPGIDAITDIEKRHWER